MKYFCVHHRRKHNQHFLAIFFRKKKQTFLAHQTKCLTNFTSQKQYLFGFLFSRNARKTPTDHNFSIHYNFFLLWKQTSHKTLKVTDEKNFFSSVYVINAACFDACFSFHLITEIPFLCRFIVTWRLFASSMCWPAFKQLFWKKSVFLCLLSPK